MNKKLTTSSVLTALLALPNIALGQFFPAMPSLASGVNLLSLTIIIATIVINATWIIAVAFVIVMFVMAGFKYLTAQGDANKVAEANKAVVWGVGGIIIILLSFSILVVMRITLGI